MTDFTLSKEFDQCNESVMAVARSCTITGSWEAVSTVVLTQTQRMSHAGIPAWLPKATDTHCAGSPWLLGPVPVSQGTWPAWTLLWTKRQGYRGNLEGSEARGESPKSTGKESLIVLMLVGKKLVNNNHFLNLKTHMVYNRTGLFQSQANSLFCLLKAREPVTHSRQ